MALRSFLPSFSDELKKIASDLMTPAVVSDSNNVTGPPATPFRTRKGYKKLELELQKEGAIDLQKAILRTRRLGRQASEVGKQMGARAGQIGKTVAKQPKRLAVKTYTGMPPLARKVVDRAQTEVAKDPHGAAQSINTAAQIARMFGLG